MRPVNLLPAEYRRDRLEAFSSPSTPVLMLGLAGVVLIAMLVGGFIVENSKVSDKRRTLESLKTELRATPPPRQPSSQGEMLQSRNQRVATLNTALIGRVAWDRVLRNLSSVLPDDVWLSNLKAGASTGPQSTASTPSGESSTAENFLLSGYAYSQDGVARLLARLEVVPDLSNVQLQKSEKTEVAGRPIVSFAIEAAVRPPGGSS